MVCKQLPTSIHSAKPNTMLALLFEEAYSFVIVFICYLEKNMALSNQFAKYFKMPTSFDFTYFFNLKKAYKNMLRSQ